MPGENGFHGLDSGDDLAVGGNVVVTQLAGSCEALRPFRGRAAKFDGSDLADKAFENFDAVAALRALAPGLQKNAVVMVVDVDLARQRRAIFDGALDAPLAAVGVPDAVVEAKLHLLIDVAGKIVGRNPARVNVEGGFTAVGVLVNHAKLR